MHLCRRPGGYFYIDWNGNIAPCVFFPYTKANVYDLYDGGGSLSSLLEGEYFSAIRSWQDDYLRGGKRVKNLFLPCPMRDHYDFAHKLVTSQAAKPMDENAAAALEDSEYRRRMMEYNGHTAELLDPLWQREVYPRQEEAHEREKTSAEPAESKGKPGRSALSLRCPRERAEGKRTETCL